MLKSAFSRDGLAPGAVVIHPRSWVDILTSVDGEDVETGIEPSRMSLHRGSHNKADEARITLDSTAFDFPIRLIGGTVVTLYLGAVEEAWQSVRTLDNRRFAGIVVDYDVDTDKRVTMLEAQDFSYLCRRKTWPVRKTEIIDPFGNITGHVDPTPYYRDSLRKNIERLLSILPEFADTSSEAPLVLRDTLALNGANLAGLVSGRAVNSPIPLKPDCTVWEGIEHLCGLLGCHVKVDINEIVVRSAEEVFNGRTSQCYFIFGGDNANSFGPKFHKKPVANRNGVRVNAINTETRKLMTAIYPAESVLREITRKQPKRPRQAPKKPSSKPKAPPAPPPRDVYELNPGHYTQAGLDAKAKAIYLERSRQEADGSVSAPVLTEEVLGLMNGDLITVKVDNDIRQQIASIGNDDDASKLLQDRMGYEKAAADALVRAARKPAQDAWYAKEITFDHPSDRLVTVQFINLVEI
jgi:hypothetical protein